jgi:hypothetical protein
MSAIVKIDYAVVPSKVRRVMRRTVVPLLVVAAVMVAAKLSPRAYRQVRLLKAQAAAMRHAEPVDRVMFEGNGDAGAKLLASLSSDYYAVDGVVAGPARAGRKAPAAWDGLKAEFPELAQHMAAANAQYAAWMPPGVVDETVLFLHEMRSPTGNRRLVALTVRPGLWCNQPLRIEALVIRPATPVSPAAILPSQVDFDPAIWAKSPGSLYPGQPDAADPSRLTLAFEGRVSLALIGLERQEPNRRVMEGRLNDDDTITVRLLPAEEKPSKASLFMCSAR